MKRPRKIVRFPGNPRPARRRDQAALIIVLPVIRIERYAAVPARLIGRTRRGDRR